MALHVTNFPSPPSWLFDPTSAHAKKERKKTDGNFTGGIVMNKYNIRRILFFMGGIRYLQYS